MQRAKGCILSEPSCPIPLFELDRKPVAPVQSAEKGPQLKQEGQAVQLQQDEPLADLAVLFYQQHLLHPSFLFWLNWGDRQSSCWVK